MLVDTIKQETERIDSRFFELVCGNGNLLVEILRRKLNIVKSLYEKNVDDYERYAVIAVASIYGMDLSPDTVDKCRNRLFEIFDKEYTISCQNTPSDETREAVRHILRRNIFCGDVVTMKTPNGYPIVLSEWAAVNGCMLKRRDFRLDRKLEGAKPQVTLNMTLCRNDKEIKALIPSPIREFPAVHYSRVQQYK